MNAKDDGKGIRAQAAGTTYSSRRISPGWMASKFLPNGNQRLNIIGIFIFPCEAGTPEVIDANTEVPRPISK